MLRKYQENLARWKKNNPTGKLQIANKASRPREPYSESDHIVPTRLYNGKIHGLEPYTLKGILWFQSDGNAGHPEEYPELIRTLIQSWRARWREELPFYYAELNNMHDAQSVPAEPVGLAFIRDAQNGALDLPGVDVATSVDLGIANDAHFPIKKPLGIRLANLAMNNLYGRPGLVHSPQLAGYTIDKEKVRLRFKYADGLRTRNDGPLKGFAMRAENGPWFWADGKIENQEVVLWSQQVSHPAAVRYAWAANPILSVENKAGLPLRPFRTDSDPMLRSRP